ncbi:MAG: dihydrodipicolinate synthase family protein [Verrucomicrobiales bacterium]
MNEGYNGNKNKEGGVFAALWIPTDGNGSLMEGELKRHLEFLKTKNLRGLMVDGSTGEFPVITKEERHRPLALAREVAPALDIIYNASHPDYRTVIELGRNAVRHKCNAIALLPPWFFPMPQEDMGEFFVRAAEGWGNEVPLLLYNFPEVTGKRIDIETIAWVADRVPVSAIKQSGAAFDYHQPLLQLGKEKNFQVFTGADTRLAEAMDLGVTGCVSGLANAIPELVSGVFQACKRADQNTVELNTKRIAEVEQAIKPLPFALNVAAAVEARGFAAGEPKYPRSAKTTGTHRAVVELLQKIFREWGFGK